MANANKFVTKHNGRRVERALCDDCVKEAIYETYVASIYSEESRYSAKELIAMPFPACDVCDASFAVTVR